MLVIFTFIFFPINRHIGKFFGKVVNKNISLPKDFYYIKSKRLDEFFACKKFIKFAAYLLVIKFYNKKWWKLNESCKHA